MKNFNLYQYAGFQDLASGSAEIRHNQSTRNTLRPSYIQVYHVVKELFYTNLKKKQLGTRQRQFTYLPALKGTATYENTLKLVNEALNIQGSINF